jgi:hypothetical protein
LSLPGRVISFPAEGDALLAVAVALQQNPRESLFAVGGVALLLLFDGIHNAWDSVAYIAVERMQKRKSPAE